MHLARKKASPAARVGIAPLQPAAFADSSMLALLALDPTLVPCDPRRALYLDTETTGLSGGTGNVAFLLGLAYFDEHEEAFVLEQIMIRKLGEEAPMLAHLARRLEDASMIVTFNGKSFDWPLLRARVVMNRMPALRELPHLDLLHVAR
ncbi:MAG: ribonuclease H-like domain-containing protein, partial [Polyangiaceae bacterium]